MGAETRITPSVDIDLTAIIERDQIAAIKNWLHGTRYSVELYDGRFGVGRSVGEAIEKAKRPDALNILRAA